MKHSNKPSILTLDAGGTNFVFSAIRESKEMVKPFTLPSNSNDLNKCLGTMVKGFKKIIKDLHHSPVAISFAFPGPADYPTGIIGDLENLPAFRGGIALGPFLEDQFNIPVFINNDGDLFAYGEAKYGILPEINDQLKKAGSTKSYKNLLGVTLGTGFGGGVVINEELLIGDNAAASEIWLLRNKKYSYCFAEESLSIRAVQRIYGELTNSNPGKYTPKDIFDIAEGTQAGDKQAAIQSYKELGTTLGDALANAITIIDGLMVIGGGLSGASKYFMPAVIKEMNSAIFKISGERVDRLESKVFNLDEEKSLTNFLQGNNKKITVPGTNKVIKYAPEKRIGIAVSKLGTNLATSLGAYAFALNKLNQQTK